MPDETGCAVDGRTGDMGEAGENGPPGARDAALSASRRILSRPMAENGRPDDVEGLWPLMFRADSSTVDMENGLPALVRGRAVRGRGLSESSLGGAHVIRGGGVKPHCRASL